MKVNGQICYNVESPVKDNISWSDGNITEPVRPWLSSYQWDDTAVAYVDTLHEQGIETIMLRIDEPFFGYPEETQSYQYLSQIRRVWQKLQRDCICKCSSFQVHT